MKKRISARINNEKELKLEEKEENRDKTGYRDKNTNCRTKHDQRMPSFHLQTTARGDRTLYQSYLKLNNFPLSTNTFIS